MNFRLASCLIVCLCALGSPLRADIVFGTGLSGALLEVGAYDQLTPVTARGRLLTTLVDIMNVQTDVPLDIPAAGAARINAVATPFTSIAYVPIGLNWDIFEINLQRAQAGTFVLEVIDDSATVWTSSSFTLDAGQNRVWASAINGQSIAKVTVLASGSVIQDARQVRLNLTAVPEPAGAALLGFGALAGMISLARRRRRI